MRVYAFGEGPAEPDGVVVAARTVRKRIGVGGVDRLTVVRISITPESIVVLEGDTRRIHPPPVAGFAAGSLASDGFDPLAVGRQPRWQRRKNIRGGRRELHAEQPLVDEN